MSSNDDAIRISNIDIPMEPGSPILRDRMTGVRSNAAPSANDPGENADVWGGYSGPEAFDNEDWDDPRHEMEWATLLAHEPTFRLFRYQNADLEEGELNELVNSPMYKGIEYLDLRRNKRTPDEAVAKIIASGAMSHLRFLNLDACYSVGNETLRAIASGAMPKLEALELGQTEITDEGLAALADSTKTPALVRIQGLYMDKITEDGVAELAAARPGLAISFAMC